MNAHRVRKSYRRYLPAAHQAVLPRSPQSLSQWSSEVEEIDPALSAASDRAPVRHDGQFFHSVFAEADPEIQTWQESCTPAAFLAERFAKVSRPAKRPGEARHTPQFVGPPRRRCVRSLQPR